MQSKMECAWLQGDERIRLIMLNKSGLLTLFAWSDIGFPPKLLNQLGVLDQADFAQLMRDPKRCDTQGNKSTHGEKPSEIDVINHLSLRVQSREHLLRTVMKKTHAKRRLGSCGTRTTASRRAKARSRNSTKIAAKMTADAQS